MADFVTPYQAPPIARAVTPESVIAATPDGVTVTVPKAPTTGEPGAPTVAVAVKPWYSSLSLWLTGLLSSGFLLDAMVPVLMDILSADRPPTDWWVVTKKLAIAVVSAYVGYRHLRENTIIGTGKAESKS